MENSFSLTQQVMSQAIAPVFLISSVVLLTNCMSLRYGRVIDRIRTLLRDGSKLYGKYTDLDHVERELRQLYRRARLLRLAVILSCVSIFFVVLAIFFLYLGLRYQWLFQFLPEIFFLLGLAVLLLSVGLFTEDFAISLASIKHDINTRKAGFLLDATDQEDSSSARQT